MVATYCEVRLRTWYSWCSLQFIRFEIKGNPPPQQNKTKQQKTKQKQKQTRKKTVDIIKTLIAVSSHSKQFISSRSISESPRTGTKQHISRRQI